VDYTNRQTANGELHYTVLHTAESLIDKLTVAQLVTTFPAFYERQKLIIRHGE
jgi:hypothetical protein